MTDKNRQEIELRNLLNDFFQDIDYDAQIDTDLANNIVDVRLKKFSELIKRREREAVEGFVSYVGYCQIKGKEWSIDDYFKDTVQDGVQE